MWRGAAERNWEPLGACRDVEQFEKLNRIGEGTYGTVYRARDRRDGRVVALKRVLLHNEASDGFPITALREIKLLKRLRHPNCVRLLDVAVGRKRSSVFLVFEYCEHDLSLLLRHQSKSRNPFKESELWPGMAALPNASALAFDASRYSYNTLRSVLPDLSDKGIDLMNRLLTYDPAVRITAREAIEHPYFREKPFPQEATLMPTFPSLHPDMKDRSSMSAPASATAAAAADSHQQRQRQQQRDNTRFGDAFGGAQAPSSAVKKRRV
ncbi:hypothetical protein PybrP1_007636 [[Pythium] brassicae (nom. inval.)]|nr:hypothetical protein PybrP1_007636 [[Pythium] brassicae (nom. inval.)]